MPNHRHYILRFRYATGGGMTERYHSALHFEISDLPKGGGMTATEFYKTHSSVCLQLHKKRVLQQNHACLWN